MLQLCYHSNADFSDKTGVAITNKDGTQYDINVIGLNTSTSENYQNPELSYFFTEYGGTINYTQKISFGLWSYPSNML